MMKEMLKTIYNDPAAARKFLVALIGAVVAAVSIGLVPAAVGDWMTVVTVFLTAYGVWAVPNERKETP